MNYSDTSLCVNVRFAAARAVVLKTNLNALLLSLLLVCIN